MHQSALAIVAGQGPLDDLFLACEPERLVAWAVRGHTLSRVDRPTNAVAAPWSVSHEVATGVSELAIVADDDSGGLPMAWRSPTAQIDGLDTDEWWVLSQRNRAMPMLRGSLSMPLTSRPGGIIVATHATASAIRVLTTLYEENDVHVVSQEVPLASGEYHRLDRAPAAIAPGELRAYERTHGVFLTLEPSTTPRHSTLVAWRFTAENAAHPTRVASVEVPYQYVKIAAQGVASATRSAFVFSGFERVAPQEQQGCLNIGPTLCVRAGPVTILEVSTAASANANAISVYPVANSGLPDGLVRTDHNDGYWVLFVHGTGDHISQSAAEFTDHTQHVRVRSIVGQGLPPLDHLTLRRCGNRVWLGAEAVVAGEDLHGEREDLAPPHDALDDALDGHARPSPRPQEERGIMAVPFSCVLQE